MSESTRIGLAILEDKPRQYRPRPVRAMAAGRRDPLPADDGETEEGCYPAVVTLGNLCLNFEVYVVTLAGVKVPLTTREFDLLSILVVHKDSTMTMAALTQWLWEATGRTYELRLKAVIRQLQAKLAASDPYVIARVGSAGYGLLDSSSQLPVPSPSRPARSPLRRTISTSAG